MVSFLCRAISKQSYIFILNTISPSTSSLFHLHYFTSNPSPHHSFTLSYLIHTCGFSPQHAHSLSKRVTLKSKQNPDLVINFFKSHGFSQPHILRILRTVPTFLKSNPENSFLPKIEFFKARGHSSSHIVKLICTCPTIMSRSLSKHLIPSYDFLSGLFQSDVKLMKSLQYCSAILIDPKVNVVPKLELLREAGVPESNIIKYLQFFSRTLIFGVGKVKKAVDEVKQYGFDPLSFQFLFAVHVCISLKQSTRAKKFDLYKKWGWSEDEIFAAFRKFPACLALSEDQIDAKLRFLVNEFDCNPSRISKYPSVLGYSLKKRIVPRTAVLKVLLSKGLLKSETVLVKFTLTEKDFLRRVILCCGQEANELLELYRKKLDQAR